VHYRRKTLPSYFRFCIFDIEKLPYCTSITIKQPWSSKIQEEEKESTTELENWIWQGFRLISLFQGRMRRYLLRIKNTVLFFGTGVLILWSALHFGLTTLLYWCSCLLCNTYGEGTLLQSSCSPDQRDSCTCQMASPLPPLGTSKCMPSDTPIPALSLAWAFHRCTWQEKYQGSKLGSFTWDPALLPTHHTSSLPNSSLRKCSDCPTLFRLSFPFLFHSV
jgi:hypothetical protein